MGIDQPFAGHALNAVDAKGRVSVPAAMRATVTQRMRASGAVSEDKGGVLHVAPHPKGDRLVAYDQVGQNQLRAELRASVAHLGPVEQREALEELRQAEMGNSDPIAYDGAGRMVLTPVLRELSGIGDLAYFLGVDDHIEIWAPDRAEAAFERRPMMLAVLRSHLKAREA